MVEPVDAKALQQVFQKAVEHFGADAFDLGAYDKMKVPQACNAQGLHANAWYLEQLLPICSGEILCQQLKQAVARHASTHNRSSYKDDLWCSQQATKFTCLLSHWRRLRREPDKLRQCLQTATGEERECIQALVKVKPGLVPGADRKACEKAKSAPLPVSRAEAESESCEKDKDKAPPSTEACKKANELEGKKTTKPKVLKAAVSDVSMDSEGFPMILKTPPREQKMIIEKQSSSGHRDALALAAEEAAAKMVQTRPCKRPASAPKHNPSPKKMKKPCHEPKQGGPGKRPWSKVRTVLAKEQSYIQGLEEGQWKLIVACSRKMGSSFPGGHQAAIKELFTIALEDDMTKEGMLQKRNSLLRNGCL